MCVFRSQKTAGPVNTVPGNAGARADQLCVFAVVSENVASGLTPLALRRQGMVIDFTRRRHNRTQSVCLIVPTRAARLREALAEEGEAAQTSLFGGIIPSVVSFSQPGRWLCGRGGWECL